MLVFAAAIAAGDIIKYQSFVYGSFVWEIHVRYNKIIYLECEGRIEKSVPRIAGELWDAQNAPDCTIYLFFQGEHAPPTPVARV